MLITETLTDGRIRHYSDSGMMIRQMETGALYDDAVDVSPVRYTYTETDTPIEGDELTDSEALSIIMGRDMDDEPTDGT